MTKTRSRAAFTLVEMLVVIGITTLVSAATIIYSSVGQNEVALTVETAKISQLILQARELALDTYSGASGACAYGVHFDLTANPQTYSLFAYTPGSAKCPSAATVVSTTVLSSGVMSAYAPSSWHLQVGQGVALFSPGDTDIPAACKNIITDVLFYPPAPTTMIALAASQGGAFSSPSPSVSSVCLRTVDGKNTGVVTINPEGQVSF
ncbi:MAG: type II secretion system protein [Candidatus Pacebacteria bacterium]|nr:type II secretion system protein [Candidatus Paceibacterota bacterium]